MRFFGKQIAEPSIEKKLSKSKRKGEEKPKLSIQPTRNEQASKAGSSTETESQQKIPMPNRGAPVPIQQIKVTKNHCGLTQIPINLISRPCFVQELYLAHNSIKSTKNILRLFTNLRNLNLSYNLLADPLELIAEIRGPQQRVTNSRIDGPAPQGIQLKMLNIRMNSFQFGYEDQFIRWIPSLERFQQHYLGRQQKKSAVVDPDVAFRLADRVGTCLLPCWAIVNRLVFQLSKSSQLQEEPVVGAIEKMVSCLSMQGHISVKKSHDSHRIELLEGMLQILNCIIGTAKAVKLDCTSKTLPFAQVLQLLLLKLERRHNNKLFDTLTRRHYKYTDKQPQLLDLAEVFGQMYHGRSYPMHPPNPAKYLADLELPTVQEHPLLTDPRPHALSDLNTLDGEKRFTASTVMRRLEQVADTPKQLYQSEGLKEGLFESFPIFVFDFQYSDIVNELLLQRIECLVRLFDMAGRTSRQLFNNKRSTSKSQIRNVEPQSKMAKNQPFSLATSNDMQYHMAQIKQKARSVQPNYSKTIRKNPRESAPETVARPETHTAAATCSRFSLNSSNATEPGQAGGSNLSKYTVYQISLAYKVFSGLKRAARLKADQH